MYECDFTEKYVFTIPAQQKARIQVGFSKMEMMRIER